MGIKQIELNDSTNRIAFSHLSAIKFRISNSSYRCEISPDGYNDLGSPSHLKFSIDTEEPILYITASSDGKEVKRLGSMNVIYSKKLFDVLYEYGYIKEDDLISAYEIKEVLIDEETHERTAIIYLDKMINKGEDNEL